MGVSTHSQERTLYIFSTMKAGRKPLENEEAHSLLTDYLAAVNVPYIELQGCYKGVHELSLLVDARSIPEEAIRVICLKGEQECYMIAENHKHGLYKATLVDTKSGQKEFIGYLRELSKEVIDRLDLDYSYRKDINKYFAVWPTDTTVMEAFDREVLVAETHGLNAVTSIGKGKLATV